ncbi:hypothetical protein ACFV2C_10955, partial [[Kitasatospora] papulosa]
MSEALLVQEAGAAPLAAPVSGARQFWRRLRAQRAATAAAAVVLLLFLAALAAPLLAALAGQDPDTFHPELVDSAAGGVPRGSFGGIGAAAPGGGGAPPFAANSTSSQNAPPPPPPTPGPTPTTPPRPPTPTRSTAPRGAIDVCGSGVCPRGARAAT